MHKHQCPNCWGYQEYSEQFTEKEICKYEQAK